MSSRQVEQGGLSSVFAKFWGISCVYQRFATPSAPYTLKEFGKKLENSHVQLALNPFLQQGSFETRVSSIRFITKMMCFKNFGIHYILGNFFTFYVLQKSKKQ